MIYVPGKRVESLASFLDFQLETEADLRGKAPLTDGILFTAVAYTAEQQGASAVISQTPRRWTHGGILVPYGAPRRQIQ